MLACSTARGRVQTDPAREGGDAAGWTNTSVFVVCARDDHEDDEDETAFDAETFVTAQT